LHFHPDKAAMGFTHDSRRTTSPEEWVLWNSSLGILVMVTLGRVEVGEHGRRGWLQRPYDMVGPFDLEQLLAEGRISFAACLLMSRRRWQQDQAALRHEAWQERRRKYAEFREAASRRRPLRRAGDDSELRKTLNLPVDGELSPAEIKAAYRRLALRAHPDGGGDHELFIRVTAARDALLSCSQ
jgi:hypothetical protein